MSSCFGYALSIVIYKHINMAILQTWAYKSSRFQNIRKFILSILLKHIQLATYALKWMVIFEIRVYTLYLYIYTYKGLDSILHNTWIPSVNLDPLLSRHRVPPPEVTLHRDLSRLLRLSYLRIPCGVSGDISIITQPQSSEQNRGCSFCQHEGHM